MLVADGADPEATLAAAVSLIADGQQLEEAITKVNLAKEVMALLLEHGADVNAGVGSSNQTSLMIAAFQGNVAVLELLLEAGADASLHGRDGLDALDTAIAVDRVRWVCIDCQPSPSPDHTQTSTQENPGEWPARRALNELTSYRSTAPARCHEQLQYPAGDSQHLGQQRGWAQSE